MLWKIQTMLLWVTVLIYLQPWLINFNQSIASRKPFIQSTGYMRSFKSFEPNHRLNHRLNHQTVIACLNLCKRKSEVRVGYNHLFLVELGVHPLASAREEIAESEKICPQHI